MIKSFERNNKYYQLDSTSVGATHWVCYYPVNEYDGSSTQRTLWEDDPTEQDVIDLFSDC